MHSPLIPLPLKIARAAALAALILAISGCSSSRSVSMHTVRPAAVTFPKDVQTILIVDRSGNPSARAEVIERVLSGEMLDQDRAGVQAMVESLRDQLAYSGRFDTKVATERLAGGSMGKALPQPLEWDVVDALLDQYGADVLLGIEVFDSDFVITKGKRMTTKTVTEDGKEREIDVPEFYAEGVADVTIGVRIYHPDTRDIIDEELFSRTNGWEAKGGSVRDALLALIDHGEAVSQMGSGVGADYATKISPMPTRLTRTFYGKSKHVPEMEQGGRHADVADWEGAIDTWMAGLAHAPTREAGQLCYNIAIAYEVLGQWEESRRWAERAWVDYGEREARGYITALDNRVRREARVAEQMR